MLFGMSVGVPGAALMGGISLHLHVPCQNEMQVSSDQRGQPRTGASDLTPGGLKCKCYQLHSRRVQE